MRSVSSPRDVSMRMGDWVPSRMRLSTSKPSMPGSITSRMMAWNFSSSARSAPAGPVMHGSHLVAERREVIVDQRAEFLVVVDDQNPPVGGGAPLGWCVDCVMKSMERADYKPKTPVAAKNLT